MHSTEVDIVNKLGLHARAAAKFVNLASTFACDVELEKDGKRVNGKSIMGVMMLAAARGSRLILHTDGPDEQEAASQLADLVNGYFGEEE
ncbi:MAG: HPr family phosphocarrier protein [Halofilum sp. (in: g-proteobacteria)]